MKKLYRTLIVEDDALVTKGLKMILEKVTEFTDTAFKIFVANRCSQALAILKSEPLIDLVFLDIKLPPEPHIEMFSGENLGAKIRELYPDTMIIVITAYSQPIRIKSIIKSIEPDGFFVKGDFSYLNLASEIEHALMKPPYYSTTVVKSMIGLTSFNFSLDTIDIRLLIELDKGKTMKEIGDILFLSRVAVTKRKQKLKLQFEVENGNDRVLINKARQLGFI